MSKDIQEAAFRQRVLEYHQNGHSVTDTANRYHLSRKTVHKWIKRWDGTWTSLVDRSRRPKNSPRKQTEAEINLVKRQAKKHKWVDIFLTAVFVAIFLLMSVIARSRSWMSICLSLFGGMLLFMMIPMMTPLDSGVMNVGLCLAGGAIFAATIGAFSNVVLKKSSLVG